MYIYININIISFKRVYFSADADEYIDLTDCLNAIFNSYGVTMLNCIFYYNTVDTREVIGMAFEVIKNIVEAENEVDSIKAAAAADAQKIKADAKAKASFQDPVLRFQRGPVHRRRADRCRRCPLCQGRQRPACRRYQDPVRWREHPEQWRKPAE